MGNSLAEIAYEASLRSLDKQEELLDEVRARTGLLLAASSLAASFLGRPALERAEPTIIALALLAFAISTGASIYILLPKTKRFIFSLQGSAVYEKLFEFSDDLPELYRRLAYDLDRFWDENDRTMTKLFRAFRFAALGLAIEVLLLLASVSGTVF